MPGEVPSSKSIYTYAKLSLKARLKALWNDRRIPEFYSVVLSELEDKVVYTLRGKHPYYTLSEEDLRDCFSNALEGFIERASDCDKPPVENPEGFLWGSTTKIALTLIKEKIGERIGRDKLKEELGYTTGNRHKRSTNPSSEGQDLKNSVLIPERSAIVLLEDLYDDISAEEPWSVVVVREAVSRLTPALRRVAEHMLVYGPDCKSPEALRDLDMPPNTYRSYRKRAIDELKQLIPEIMDEWGYNFRRVSTPEVFTETIQPIPSEDGGEECVDYTYSYEDGDESEET